MPPAPTSKLLSCTPAQKLPPQEKSATPLTSKAALNGPATPDLDLVLSRAARYVEEYEAELGNLIGEETYVQSPADRKKQRTESDFAILQVGKEWVGMRDVRCLDGVAVQHKAADFQKILNDSPAAVLKTLDNISHESARYNIGPVQRTTNLPTFALRILRQHNLRRFDFQKTGETIIGGIRTWAVSFQELQTSTLVGKRPRSRTVNGPRQ